MQAVTCDVILSSVRTRSDNSLGLSMSTPELSPDEMLVFLQLKQQNLKMLLQPIEGEPTGLKTVTKETETKTPSQRLRAILFCQFRQQKPTVTFDEFYARAMSRICEEQKQLLEPEHV